MKLYNEIPDMECLSGDTLDFEVDVDGLSELTSPTMRCTVSKRGVENSILVNKACTAKQDGTGYTVTLDSSDTENLKGAYWMDFILTAGGTKYKKLRGCIVVYPQYGGAS